MPYSVEGDLLLGDVLLGPGFSKAKAVQDAADEMDAKLGYLYALPLRPITPEGENPLPAPDPGEPDNRWKSLPAHQVLLLKGINNRLASGRLILAMAVGQEGTTLHAYGYNLVQEALAELLFLANGTAILDAEKMVPVDPDEIGNKAPVAVNHDSESLLEGFESTVMRGKPWYSRPGLVP